MFLNQISYSAFMYINDNNIIYKCVKYMSKYI